MSVALVTAKSRSLKALALGSTATTVLVMAAACGAMAQPATNSLPGSFSTNQSAVTYLSNNPSATSATIGNIPNAATVLQWGGTPLTNSVAHPAGATTNTGFSIGNGATLDVSGGGASASVLANDLTGSPSQIYGILNASGLTGPLYIANASGVIVGSTGNITAPADGVGLLGYLTDSTTFAGTVSVGNTTGGTGTVTVSNGATTSGGTFLIAGNGTVNVDTPVNAGDADVLVGWGFSTGAGSVTPTANPAQISGTTSVLNFSGGSPTTPLSFDQLYAGGALNNAGTLQVADSLQSGGNLTNTGVIRNTTDDLTLTAGLNGTKGNVDNTGVINFTSGSTGSDTLTVDAANVYFGGSVQLSGNTLSSSYLLDDFALNGDYGSTASGVVDLASSIYTYGSSAQMTGQAVRVLSGGLWVPEGTATIDVGTGHPFDPFTGATLGYNLSLFPGTTVVGSDVTLAGSEAGSLMNLDGFVSTQVASAGNTIEVTANTVNGVDGGFKLSGVGSDPATLDLNFSGNINNPYGAANAGSTAFQYNFIPVIVSNTATGSAGSVILNFTGPTATSGTDQNVNLLVEGNAILGETVGSAPLTPPPTGSVTAASPYDNNHLVLQSTGNINFESSGQWYWPGLVYLSTVASASNPTVLSSSGSITLGDSNGDPVDLNNMLAADTTTNTAGGRSGDAGIALMTNNLNFPNGATVTTSNDSGVTFATAAIASAFQIAHGSSFYQAYFASPGVLQLQQLPASYFLP